MSDLGSDSRPAGDSTAEATPDHYRSFSRAVLAQHRRVRANRVEVCTCGAYWKDCEVVILARRLLPPD
jgi:hypothetical protein